MDSTDREVPASAGRRLAWFIGIWAAGVLGLGVLSYGLRWALGL